MLILAGWGPEGLFEIIENRVKIPGGTAAVNAEGRTTRKQAIGKLRRPCVPDAA